MCAVLSEDPSNLTDPAEEPSTPDGIAIVGMAGRFPGAADIEAFWRNLRDGVESLSVLTREELAAAGVEPALLDDPRLIPVGGVLDGVETFDASFFGFGTREAEAMDPQIRQFLEVSWEAFESAGYDSESYSGTVGIFGGMGSSSYLIRHLLAHPDVFYSLGTLQARILTDKDFLVSMAAFKMNLTGPSINVQTACSTSMVATVLACQSLVTYQCDVALAGGSTILLPQAGYLPQEGVSSPDGRCRAFDARSQGTVGGSGAGVVVLKRLADALAEGDTVHAVIKGFATNNDGSFKMGYTAPGIEGQIQVVAMAQAVAGIRGDSITYVEAHGTGTPLGDPIEVDALTEVFRSATDRTGYCALGSVKSNIGHLDTAAGVASLIKTTLALEHRQIPPSLGFEIPNPQIDFAASPFFVNTKLREWTTDGAPRRAGVSSFAIGGVNAHVVLEEAPPVPPGDPAADLQLLVLSAKTETALDAATDRLARHLREHPEVHLADAAYTLQVGRRAFRHRRALVCRGREDALAALEARDPRRLLAGSAESRDARVAFLFPGLGNHHVGMARDLYREEARFREVLDECAALLAPELGLDLRKILYPEGIAPLSRSAGEGLGEGALRALLGRTSAQESPAEAEAARRLRRTELAQPAMFAVEYALARLLMDLGLQPEAMLGFSVGEYVAACLAGVFDLGDAVRLVARRAKMISELPTGAMLAVPLPEAAAGRLAGTELSIAAVLGPELTVLAGPEPAVAAVEARLAGEGLQVRRLETEHAFHSRMMDPIAGRFRELFRGVRLQAPEIPFLSNVTGTWITAGQATDPGYWADHLRKAVRFADGVAELWREPGRALVEAGPGQTLTSWALQHPAAATARDGVAVATMRHGLDRQDDQAFLLTSLARLWLAGVRMDWNAFWAGQRRLRVPLPTYPFERLRYWLEPGYPMMLSAAAASQGDRGPLGEMRPAAVEGRTEDAQKRAGGHGGRLRPELPVPFAEPRDEVERLVALVWKDLLAIDRIGVWDGFFDLGGDSIMATKLVTRLNEAFAAGFSLRSVFEKPTVADMAAVILARRAEGGRIEEARIPRIPRDGGPLPVSFAQRRLWFLDQLAPGDPFYNVPAAAELSGPVDPVVLGRCFLEIVRRHETLRTRLVNVDGEPFQSVEPPPASWTVPLVDLRGLPFERREPETRLLAAAEARRPFDLAQAPLLRTLLVRLEERRHAICVTMHHTVSDGWSNVVFLTEMAALHQAFLAGEPSPLPDLPIQYADFAAWQLAQFEGGVLAEQLAWWSAELTGLPPGLDLPTDRPRPPVQTFGGARVTLAVPPTVADGLRRRGREEGATLYMLLLAAMDVLLYRHTGQTSFAVGTAVANRNRRETENLIGFFTNTLVLRAAMDPEETFRALLRRTRDVARQAFQHQDLPFEKIVEELQPQRDLSRSPFFQVMMVETLVERSMLDDMGIRQLDVDPGVARFDFLFDMSDQGSEVTGVLEYNSDLFDATTADRIVGRWLTLLAAIAEDGDVRVGEMRMLDAEEWAVVAGRPSPPGPLSHTHSHPPGRGGELPALIALDGSETSYAELRARANQLARWLRRQGVGPDVPVALSLERSPELFIALQAVLAAGGVYVPLDPEYPAERRAVILEDAGAALVLTRPALADGLPLSGTRIVDLGALDLSAESADDLPPLAGPQNLAYLLYTSGSTGRPKGVAMTRGALDNLIAWQMAALPGAWRTLQFTSINFDVSYQEIVSTWAAGGALVLISEEDRRDPAALLAVLRARRVERLFLPFVALQQIAEAAREEELPASLREVITAGEQLRMTPALVEMFRRLPGARLHNQYGPTEAHVVTSSTLAGDPAGWPVLPPIGRALPGTRAVVLDPHGGPAPLGVSGELMLGGVCLARGYLGRPDLTAERFVPDPLGDRTDRSDRSDPSDPPGGGRLYRTGDRARLQPRAGGPPELEFFGRLDDQVKIRGYRVEPGEVESVLAAHPQVAAAAVAVRESAGGRRLVAWVVAEGGAPGDLRAFLAARLPEHAVPSSITVLDAFPLTPSGKVDRRALPAPVAEMDEGRFVEPRTPTETVLAGIWREVLELPRLGVSDDFFALGGHSLLATRITARVRAAFGVALPVRVLFEAPTVARLAERIDEATATAEAPEAPPLLPVPRGGDFPLSYAQRRLWFLQTLDPDSAAYNMTGAFRLSGALDPAALFGALREIARRHEALRTTFHPAAGEPVQRIAAEPAIALPLIDLSGLPETARSGEAQRVAESEGRRPFDLERAPLLRTALLRLGPAEHLLTTTMNHAVGDGWSLGVLAGELAVLYPAFVEGVPAVLPVLPVQMADYAVWQRQWLEGETLLRLLAWWRARLAGADAALRLPSDRPRPAGLLRQARTLRFRLPAGLSNDLEALGRPRGTTLFMILLAGWEAVLHRWSGQGDFTVGSPIANRHPAEVEGVIGCFVNTLALRARVAGAEAFDALLARVRDETLGAYDHQDLPFEVLVEALQPDRVLSRAPVFQVLFALQNTPMPRFELAGLVLTSAPVDLDTPKLDLSLILERSAEGIEASLEFAADLFDGATVARLARHWEVFLAGAAAAPEKAVGLLPLLTEEEKSELLSAWVPPARPVEGTTLIHERFAEWVRRTPEAPALRDGAAELSYRQLAQTTDRLATELIAAGVRPGDRVGIGMPRSGATVVAALGILKAGAAWLYLDPSFPRDRLALMAGDAGISALVTDEGGVTGPLREALPEEMPVLYADTEPPAGNVLLPPSPPPLDLPGNALAYVIYTSGSTGRPKGVCGTHVGALNLVEALQRGSQVPPGTVCSQWASYLFDASVLELWNAWLVGGCIDVVPDGVRTDGPALAAWMERRRAGCIFLAPAMLADFAAGCAQLTGPGVPLVQLTSGGEAILTAALQSLARRHPGSHIYDIYGPTETSIVISFWRYPTELGKDLAASSLYAPIGTPFSNLRVYLLSPEGEPVPVGVPGEVFAGGPYLAQGYLARPDLTAERFLPDPFGPLLDRTDPSDRSDPSDLPGGGRLYRTGDLARWRPDGLLEFIGRVDHQVKIRGLRIELGEIEAALMRHPDVAEAAVLAPVRDGERRLEAYVAAVPGTDLTAADLRQSLAASLPDYMVPAAFAFLDALPRNTSDKIDRHKLAAIEPETAAAAEVYVAPRTPEEELLAGVWSEVLGVPRVGATDDFFALGGHSLLATRVVSRLQKLLGLSLPVRALFEAPTVESLALKIQGMGGGAPLPAGGEATGEGTGVRSRSLPLSFAQERIWFLEQLQPGGTAYHLPAALDLRGALDPGALAATLAEIFRRHEALRTVFRDEGGNPVQVILPPPPPTLPLLDLRALPEVAREAEAGRLAAEWFRRPFDLRGEPMLRAALLDLAPGLHRLILLQHHIASDGWSIGVLIQEVAALYPLFAGLPGGRRLPELPLQFADFAIRQRRELSGETLERLVEAWRRQLDGAPPALDLPTDRPRPRAQDFRGAILNVTYGTEGTSTLAALAREEGATLFMTLLAVFQVLLQRWSGEDDVVVGTPVAGRMRPEVEELIGVFINTLALRGRLDGDPTFRELAGRAREAAFFAYAHQELPFETLVERLHPVRDLARPPVFQTMFALQNAPLGRLELPGLVLEPLPADARGAKLEMLLSLTEEAGGLAGGLEYNTTLFHPATAERFLRHFGALLDAAAAGPDLPISRLSLLGAEERLQLLGAWAEGGAVPEGSDEFLPSRFAARAAEQPAAVALTWNGQDLSYGDLAARSWRLARHLRGLGVGPEVRVGVCLERSPDLVVAILAVLAAGGAYVPIEPALPAERRSFLLRDAGVSVLVARRGLLGDLSLDGVHLVDPGEEAETIARRAAAPLRETGSPDQLAYLIYTSGSTGTPKGVAITHRSATAFLRWALGFWDRTDLAAVLAATSVSFDLSVFELFAPLAVGGRVVLVDDALGLRELPPESGVTLVNTVPSAMAELLRLGALPASVRVVNLAGEPLRRPLAEAVFQAGVPRLFNLYGPSEDTTYSTWAEIGPGDEAEPGIGRPIAGTQAYVLDPTGDPAPTGVPGELCLAGAGLARGYLGRPDLTAERFVPSAFSDQTDRSDRSDPSDPMGSRLYRTGDRARWRPDGTLELLGRLDHQVKIRGFRIELGEIEAALLRQPGVAEAAVLAPARDGAAKRLEAYVAAVPGTELTAAGLRRGLAARLPEPMIPSAFALLDALPHTPSGKVDRRQLAAIVPEGDAAPVHVAPRTRQEGILASVWAEVLGVPRVGATDDFFALGGHSLLAAQVVSRLQQMLGIALPVRALFEHPTVEALALRLPEPAAGAESCGDDGLGVQRVPRDRPLPLSFAQERIWFLERLLPGGTAYHLPALLNLRGTLDPRALAAAFAEILRRHEALRTVFREEGGRPVQVVLPPPAPRLPLLDLQALPDAPREHETARLAEEWFCRPFDLRGEPMLRTALLALAPGLHRLLLLQHHIASDGWSTGLLVREVAALYPLFAGLPGGTLLPELPIQFADFAVWQREHLRGAALERLVAAGREQLAGAPPAIDLPTDRPRPRTQDFRGATISVACGPRGTTALAALARQEHASLFMALLAVFQVLLQRWSGEDDVVVGTPVAGRTRPEVENLIGVFINTLALRGRLHGDPAFRELVDRARETAFEAFAIQELPFETLVEKLHPVRDLGRPPVFQTMLALQNVPFGRLELPGLVLEPLQADAKGAKLELLLSLAEEGGGLAGVLEYSTALFDRSTAERLLRHFGVLLESAAAEPDLPISRLSLLGAEERLQLLGGLADGGAVPAGADDLLHARFAALAAERPEAPALTWGGGCLSYGELAGRAWQLARHLRSLGAGPEVRVGICLERSPDLVVAILAVLAAGSAYVPVEPGLPVERRAFLLRDAGAQLLVARRGLLGDLRLDGLRLVDPGEEEEAVARHAAAPLPPAADPGNLAYLIYTSGSTGVPKGVAITHRSATAFLRWAETLWSREELAAVLAATSVSFDLSVFELFAPLSVGGRVVLVDNALRLRDLAAGGGVTLVNTVPSAMAELLRLGAVPPSVRVVNLAGEPLRRALADGVFQAGVPRLLNLYGPSEDTTYSTWEEVEPDATAEPGIGRPIAGTRAYVLDAQGEPAATGVPGELFLAGAGLARGYLGRPDLTAERFVPDPFVDPTDRSDRSDPSDRIGDRLYRTGDRARRRPDGSLEFLGRLDHQVKIRGFRIELGEIEAALLDCSGIAEAAVLAREQEGGRRLEAYLAGAPGREPSLSAIRSELGRRLPEHMIPGAVVFLPSLPRTATGKVDRRALAQIEATPGGIRREYVPPRTEIETWLAETCGALLGAPRVGLRDRFFDLGGHSLLATQLIARLRDEWQVELPLQDVFAATDIGDLADRITNLGLGQADDADLAALLAELGVETSPSGETPQEPPASPAIHPLPRPAETPLSFAQLRLWIIDRIEPGTPVYNVALSDRLEGELDPALLAHAFGEVARRHEAVRTTFATHGGEPVQIIHPPAPVPLPFVDLGELPEALRLGEAVRLAHEEERRPFDLEHGPVLRAALLRLAPAEHVLLLTLHHIVCDEWSIRLLFREVVTLYAAERAGRPAALPALPVQYADYAVWQRGWLAGPVLQAQLAFWRSRLADPPVLELPTDRPRPPVQTFRGANVFFNLPGETSAALLALAHRHGATPFITLLAAFQALLARTSGQTDLTVGTPITGRTRSEVENLIGFFLNTLVVRADLAGDPGFGEIVERTRARALEAFAHQDLPFEKLVDEIGVRRSLGHTPLFQVLFVLLHTAPRPDEGMGFRITPLPTGGSTTAKFDLTLALQVEGEALSGVIEHNTDLFDRTTILRLAERFHVLCAAAVREPERRLSGLPLLAESEAHQVLHELNGRPPRHSMSTTAADVSLFGLVAARAGRDPERIAVEWEGGSYTYADLVERALALAARLRALGVGPEVPVGCYAGRGPELPVALLGVFASGGAWLPIDPAYPRERQRFILEDAGAPVLLVPEALADEAPETDAQVILLGPSPPDPLSHPLPSAGRGGIGTGYVIYTSGSTGRPKGIAVPERVLANLILWQIDPDRPGATPEASRTLQLSSPSFDVSLQEMFSTWCTGGTLVLSTEADRRDPGHLARHLAEGEIERLFLPFVALQQLADRLAKPETPVPGRLRRVFTAGEQLQVTPQVVEAFRRLAAATGGTALHNHYGPSETHVTTELILDGDPARWPARPSIGRPLAGTSAVVLDRAWEPAPLGVPGELALGGICPATGYRGRPDLTAEKFIPDPFGDQTDPSDRSDPSDSSPPGGGRLYRTGDLARLLPDGNIELFGRIDHQVKIRGYRIELGEVEAVLAAHPRVRECAVAVRGEAPGEKRLIAWFVAEGEVELTGLRDHLRARLPEPMVPTAFVQLDALPLTPTGKVLHAALPAPEGERLATAPYVEPHTALEREIAAVFREELSLARVGREDNFFDLGGHSLTMVRAAARLSERLGRHVAVLDLFRTPTVASLARQLEGEGEALPARETLEERSATRRQSLERRRELRMRKGGGG